jgi:hypothetical protein
LTQTPWLRKISQRLAETIRPKMLRYRFQSDTLRAIDESRTPEERIEPELCPSCGSPIVPGTAKGLSWCHNVETCRLVNIALSELGVSVGQFILVDVYWSSGPLKGYYSPADPYTIHISEEAYSQFPQYIIFHETKHLVDCLTNGQSEESTPDPFARSLCVKYGFRCPPPHQHYNSMNPYNAPFGPWPPPG